MFELPQQNVEGTQIVRFMKLQALGVIGCGWEKFEKQINKFQELEFLGLSPKYRFRNISLN